MKSRKTLEIRFPSTLSASMYLWYDAPKEYSFVRDADGVTMRVAVQRRTARRDVAHLARVLYGAQTRTVVG